MRMFEALGRRDADGFVECVHEDVEWLPLSAIFGDGGGPPVVRGRDALKQWILQSQGRGYSVQPIPMNRSGQMPSSHFKSHPRTDAR